MDESPEHWIEVSLHVPGEEAEAVAEVLARFAPAGVAIEATRINQPEDSESGQPVGLLRVCAYLPVDSHIEDTRRRLEEALWYLGRIRPLPEPDYRPLVEVDWTESWKQYYQPLDIGQKLAIVPAWIEPANPERIPIRIEPGMAFGTGTHPTTQLCLELIESELPRLGLVPGGWNVIDVGCGSGILSIAALKLGAGHALGVDIDPAALKNARHNASLNQVNTRFELGVGSVTEIKAGLFSHSQAPLVLANILAPIIIRLFENGLDELLLPGGRLILSGILVEQTPGIMAALTENDLALVARRQLGDWISFLVERD